MEKIRYLKIICYLGSDQRLCSKIHWKCYKYVKFILHDFLKTIFHTRISACRWVTVWNMTAD